MCCRAHAGLCCSETDTLYGSKLLYADDQNALLLSDKRGVRRVVRLHAEAGYFDEQHSCPCAVLPQLLGNGGSVAAAPCAPSAPLQCNCSQVHNALPALQVNALKPAQLQQPMGRAAAQW